jgi:hypothetical protein
MAANVRQNTVHDLTKLYDELGYELIDLYKVDRSSCKVRDPPMHTGWLGAACKSCASMAAKENTR